jgi:hypothetical protein
MFQIVHSTVRVELQGSQLELINTVESYPRGYPRLAALQSSDYDFAMFRRFATIHTRCLLLAQEEISSLEKKLQEVDQTERTQLFLSSREHDGNAERKALLQELRLKLREYGWSSKRKPSQWTNQMG